MKQAVFHGQEMWIGIADVASGTIRETHTLEEAKRADFHTCFYFSEESEKKHENKDGIFFWVQDGKVELEYNDLSPYEKTLLETQIKAQVIILDQDESVLRKTMLSERQENNNRDGNRMQIQILYSCNEWKEHSSMKIVCATTNPEVLYALIGESIKAGDMEYGCEDKEKGWELFQQDYGKQQIRLELLQYGFVESMPNLSISDKTSIRNYSEVYLVYTALHNQRAEEILRPLHLDRQCLIYSMADVHSDYGSNQIILSGFGKEEALRASELFEAYESNEDYLELKVEVSTYKVGKGNIRECSKEEITHKSHMCHNKLCYTMYTLIERMVINMKMKQIITCVSFILLLGCLTGCSSDSQSLPEHDNSTIAQESTQTSIVSEALGKASTTEVRK